MIDCEDLVNRPFETIRCHCAAVGIPFIPGALNRRPEDRREWRRTAPIRRTTTAYERTIDNDPS